MASYGKYARTLAKRDLLCRKRALLCRKKRPVMPHARFVSGSLAVCPSVCVYLHYICIYTHAHTITRMYIPTYLPTYTHTHTHTHTRTRTHTRTHYTSNYSTASTLPLVVMRVCMCTHTHTHTHTQRLCFFLVYNGTRINDAVLRLYTKNAGKNLLTVFEIFGCVSEEIHKSFDVVFEFFLCVFLRSMHIKKQR